MTQRMQARSMSTAGRALYHRREAVVCCITPGEMEDGGLEMRVPVMGFTIGIALLLERRAEGWWIFKVLLLIMLLLLLLLT